MAAEVSIIVPVYGVERYIGRCAESIFSQTVTPLEIIFVDDCSPDGSIAVVEGVLERFPERKDQVRIVRLEKNGGVDNARRQGCSASSGEYVLFVDSDDYIEPQMVEVMLARARETGADMTVCRFNKVEEDGKCEPSVHRDLVENRDKYLGYMISLVSANASPNIFNKLFRKDLLQKIRVIPQGNIAEDWVICVQAAHMAEKIASIDDLLYNYVQRSGSIMHDTSLRASKAAVKADTANIELILGYLENEGLTKHYRNQIAARKYVAKGSLDLYCEDPKIYKEWKSIYSEVNWIIVFNPCLVFYDKKHYLLKLLRIRKQYYNLTGKIRALLNIH